VGGLFLAAGEPVAAAIPLAYAALNVVGVVVLVRTGRFERFRLTQQVAMFVLPVALHLELGGFVASGGVVIWSFLAIVLALLFGGDREARGWFAAFAVAVVAVALVQPSLAVGNSLPGGTGLGLTVSHNIVVRQHGGRMTVASEPGRTVFTVTLPLVAFEGPVGDSGGESTGS
jgi:hypothetical protein